MKILCSLFCIYLILSTTFTCVDVATCDDISQIVATKNHSATTDSHENESCSTLCHCTCCGILLHFETAKSIIFKNETYDVFHLSQFFFKTNYIAKNFYSIWQPPKIGL